MDFRSTKAKSLPKPIKKSPTGCYSTKAILHTLSFEAQVQLYVDSEATLCREKCCLLGGLTGSILSGKNPQANNQNLRVGGGVFHE